MYLVTTYVAKHTKSNSSKKVPPLFRVCQGLPERHCAQWGEILSEIACSPDPTTNFKTMNPNIHELFYQSKYVFVRDHPLKMSSIYFDCLTCHFFLFLCEKIKEISPENAGARK